MRPAFSRKTVITVVCVCTASFVGGMLLMIFAQDLPGVESNRFDTFGVSATGHQALYELLDELDIPVFRSTWESGKRAGPRGLLLVLQPGFHAPGAYTLPDRFAEAGSKEEHTPRGALEAAMRRAHTTVFVLPKWRAKADRSDADWIADPELLDESQVRGALGLADVNAAIVRPQSEDDLAWRTGGLGPDPMLRHVQLIRSEMLDPIISSDDGLMLVGETRIAGETDDPEDRRRLIVISDPDLLANHGLLLPANSVLAVQLIESLRHGGAVIMDETCHGHIVEPSFWREVFTFPLALIGLHMVFCVLMLLWVGMGRFGTPGRPPPEIDPGNRYLIRNTADLLRYGGHTASMLRRYANSAVRDVSRQLHAPPGMGRDERHAWFERVEQSRRTTLHYRDVVARVGPLAESRQPAPERVLRAARLVYDWKQEILHGPASS